MDASTTSRMALYLARKSENEKFKRIVVITSYGGANQTSRLAPDGTKVVIITTTKAGLPSGHWVTHKSEQPSGHWVAKKSEQPSGHWVTNKPVVRTKGKQLAKST